MSEKRKCKFSDMLKAKYPNFSVGRNEHEAKCQVCDNYISVSNKGSGDLDRHINSDKHKKNIQNSAGCSKVSSFFLPKFSKLDDQVSAAEGTVAFHTVNHHLSYRSNDCTSVLFKTLFTDSETAKKYACARTKTEAIINNILSPHAVEVVIEVMHRISCFGVSVDGSNHGNQKLFPILVQYFDWKTGIKTKVLELKTTPNETAKTISSYILDTLKKYNLQSKCVAFSGDNTNANFGGISRKSGENVFTYLKSGLENDLLVGVGCPAHILHNTIHHGCDLLSYDIDSIVMKIHNYFSIYTVRTEELKEFCDSVEIHHQQLIKHCKTRWLSLFPSIERILKLYPALKAYFLSQEKAPKILTNFFQDDLSEAYFWFLHSLMSVFHLKIEGAQKEMASVIEVRSYIKSIEKSLQDRQSEKFIPLKVRNILKNIRDNEMHEKCDDFENEVLMLYSSCLDYLRKWTTQLDEFECFEWMNLKKESASLPFENLVPSLTYLQERGIHIADDKLFDQFQCLKQFIAAQSGDDFFDQLLHMKWVEFFTKCMGCFSELLKICEFYFALPSSNSSVERVFSHINVQWSDERNQLNIEAVKGILIVKYNFKQMTCSEFHKYLISKPDLLRKISSSQKYSEYS